MPFIFSWIISVSAPLVKLQYLHFEIPAASTRLLASRKLPLLLRAGRIGLFCTIKGRETSAHFPALEMARAADLQLPASPGASFGGANFSLFAFDLRQGKG